MITTLGNDLSSSKHLFYFTSFGKLCNQQKMLQPVNFQKRGKSACVFEAVDRTNLFKIEEYIAALYVSEWDSEAVECSSMS